MMQKCNLDDGDGQISRAEFILLCSVRLGALSPELIAKINERFKVLDVNHDGTLSYAEILEKVCLNGNRVSKRGGLWAAESTQVPESVL